MNKATVGRSLWRPRANRLTTPRHGIAAILAMLYLVLFSTLAIGFYVATTMSGQIARNQRSLEQGQAAADGGMQFMRYQMGQMLIPPTVTQAGLMDAVAAQLGLLLNNTPNMNGHLVQNSNGAIYIPASNDWVCLDPSVGTKFRAVLKQSGMSVVMTVTGCSATATTKRAIQLQYTTAPRAGAIFNYGVASRSPITMYGNVSVQGATNPAMGSVLVDTATGNGLTMNGNPSISGDYSYVNPSATNTFSGTIAGYAPSSPNFSQHIHAGVTAPLFPWIDTTPYLQYATNLYVPGSTTLNNVILPPGSYNFSGGMTINGVLYIQSPSSVTFSGGCNITGVIVTDNSPLNVNLTQNQITLLGNCKAQSIANLPSTYPAGERALTGAFIIAPHYTVNMGGNFGTVNGSIIASQFNFYGTAGGTIQGSIINLDDSSMTLGGKTALIIQSTGTSNYPAGVSFGNKYVPLPGTYLEVPPQ